MNLPTVTAPFQSHSETSRAAAETIEPRLNALHQLVLNTLRQWGPLTDEAIAGILGISQNTARPRRIELCESAHVVDSGDRRKTNSGGLATLWRVTTPEERAQILQVRADERERRVDRIGELEEALARAVNVLPDCPAREYALLVLGRHIEVAE